jgi:WD40 repeat protein
VLVVGGYDGNNYLASAELYDPASGAWSATGPLATARSSHTATLLPDGKVLVAGGSYYDVSSHYLATAELYDPATGAWSATGTLATARSTHTATLLPTGKVLVSGGFGSGELASAELYDPVSGSWTTTGALAAGRRSHTATLLPNGKVLLAGGYPNQGAESSTIPATGAWSGTGTTARYDHSATLLPNGKVLVAGGYSGGFFGSAELYDPATGLWTATELLAAPRWSHKATLLPDGKVLVTGGYYYDGDEHYDASAELSMSA